MGFRVPEMTAQTRNPLDKGTWSVEFKKFVHGESSQKGTPFVQVIFKVTDEDAVDTEGNPYQRDLYGDTFYLTEAAMWRLKQFASQAEVEIPDAGEEYDSLGEYASDLTDAFQGLEGTVVTDLEEFTDKNGNDREKTVVVEYHF